MEFKAKLNLKFYVISLLLLGVVIFGWYSVYFLNANEILMEDNSPMDKQTKLLFTIFISIVVASWTLSFFTVLKQIFTGFAFIMDADGIHSTATAINVLAFLFVIPIQKIPYSAIQKVSEEQGQLTLHIDKTKLEMIPILRIFARKQYHFFSGFTVEEQEEIKSELNRYITQDENS